jgi:tetratricopeptide (TPR) repeat protein
MGNSDVKMVKGVLLENITSGMSGAYLLEGDSYSNNLVIENISDQLQTDYFVYEISCKSLITDSYSFVKRLISPYIKLLENDNPSLLVKYKQSLCLLMPYLRENSLFENVILGLDVPREENPTSFTMSFITSMLNGIINFLLEVPRHYAKDKQVLFILKDIDKCDFSSVQLINRLVLRSSVSSYHILLSSSKKDLLTDKRLKFTMRYSFNTPTVPSKKDMNVCQKTLSLKEREEILSEYIKTCGIQEEEALSSFVYKNATNEQKIKYHRQQIKFLNEEEKDLTSKYAKLIYHLEAINEGKIEETLEEAAYHSRISGYYNEAVYYVSRCQRNYWENYTPAKQAKLLRIKGVGHIRLKENSQALESLKESLKLANDPYFKARLCYTIGSFVIKHDDNNLGPAWLEKGFAQLRGIKNEKATLERLWLNNSMALIKYRNHDYEDAIRIEKENLLIFKKTFNSKKHAVTHAILHYNTAYVLQDSGELEEAINHINEGIQLVPSNLDLYNNKGNILQLMGKYEEAITYYNKVKNEGYPKVEVYINCGNAYVNKGRLDLALKDFNFAIRLTPEHPNTWNARGHLKHLQEQYDSAITDFSRALEIEQNFIPARINRANAFAELGKKDEALSDYKHAEEIAPHLVEIYINRASIFQESGDWQRAKKDLEFALELSNSTNRAYIYVNLAVIASHNNELQKAKEYLELAISHNSSDPWIRFNKAHLHMELKEIAYANSEISKALEISPDTKEFHELKKEISSIELV